jgi:predicted aconitase with swiveling domain
MEKLQGRGVMPGRAEGQALVSRMPLNVTGSFSGMRNIFPGQGGIVSDRHHDLYRQNVRGRVLVFPTAIGSTYTGMILLRLIDAGFAPAALIVQNADSLLVSGVVLARVWFEKDLPVIEYAGADLYEKIRSGDRVTADGKSGEILINP